MKKTYIDKLTDNNEEYGEYNSMVLMNILNKMLDLLEEESEFDKTENIPILHAYIDFCKKRQDSMQSSITGGYMLGFTIGLLNQTAVDKEKVHKLLSSKLALEKSDTPELTKVIDELISRL